MLTGKAVRAAASRHMAHKLADSCGLHIPGPLRILNQPNPFTIPRIRGLGGMGLIPGLFTVIVAANEVGAPKSCFFGDEQRLRGQLRANRDINAQVGD